MSYQFTARETNLLLSEVARGNELAFGRLLKKYDSQLNGYIQSFTRSEELTQEMVQDVFLKIWMNRGYLTEIKSFKSYLFVIARNHTYDCLKQINRKKKKEKEWVNSGGISFENDEEESADDQHAYERIAQKVALLPPQQKKIYTLRSEGCSRAEIAEKLNLSQETVKKHLHLAMRFLRVRLSIRITSGLIN